MNIIQALKSGRPFRRTDTGDNQALWLDVNQHGTVVYGKDTCIGPGLTTEMLLATYEIQEHAVTITRSELIAAIQHTKISVVETTLDRDLHLSAWSIEEIARRVGLGVPNSNV